MPIIQTPYWRPPLPNIGVPPRLVAAGTAGIIHTIERGAFTVTARASGISNDINMGMWTGTAYLLGGDGGQILRSTDGITWSIVRAAQAGGQVRGMVWNGIGRIYAFLRASNVIRYVYSEDDGLTWSAYADITSSGSHAGVLGACVNWQTGELFIGYENITNAGIRCELVDYDTLSPLGVTYTLGANSQYIRPGSVFYSIIDNRYYVIMYDIASTGTRLRRMDADLGGQTNVATFAGNFTWGAQRCPTPYVEYPEGLVAGCMGQQQEHRRYVSTDKGQTYPYVQHNLGSVNQGGNAENILGDWAQTGFNAIGSNVSGIQVFWNGVGGPTFIRTTSYGTTKNSGPRTLII